MVTVIDTDDPVSAARLNQLWDFGVRTVGRYLNRRNPGEAKVIKPDEARLFQMRGMRLLPIYEFDGKPNGSMIGTLDGEYTIKYLPLIGCPLDGTAIVAYTVDYDAPPEDLDGIKRAFQAFGAAVRPHVKLWSYGSGYINAELYSTKLVDGRWLSCSRGWMGTIGSLAHGAYEMKQSLPEHLFGLDVDPDTAFDATQEIGFIPFEGVGDV